MSDQAILQNFQERMNIHLPNELQLLRTSDTLPDYYEVPTVAEFVGLEFLTADLPPRMIPVLRQSSGDLVAIYFPHDDNAPFVAFFTLEESRVIPQSADLNAYFADVDAYAPDHPDNDDEVKQTSPEDWSPFIFNPSTFSPLDLLKPLFLNTSLDAEQDAEDFAPLIHALQKSSSNASKANQLIQEAFNSANDLMDSTRWMSLSKVFAEREMWFEAIRACENAESTLNIHPFYGFPTQKDSQPNWIRRHAILEYLSSLVENHGDPLSRLTVAKKLEVTALNIRMG